MRIVVCPSDKQAVGFYRLGLPAMTLMEQDDSISFQFLPGLPLNVSTITGDPVSLADDFDCDILILQRPMARYQTVAMQSAQARGIKVIVELDDDFHSVDKRSKFGQQTTTDHLRTLNYCVKHADLVTVSTDALAKRYAPHGRVAVLRNCVDARWLDIKHPVSVELQAAFTEPHTGPRTLPSYEPHVVGWTGTVAYHRDDLQATHGGAAMATHEHKAIFRVIGRSELARENLNLQVEPDLVPWQTMDQYPHEIARLHVGIAPLADTAFNKAKSWLKPLEYAACGVPAVMSPTAEYKRLHDDYGIGILAGYRSREWKRAVARLLTDTTHHAEMVEHGRAMVRDHHTIQGNAWKWSEAWASVLKRKAAVA